jgi:hypothetical protein
MKTNKKTLRAVHVLGALGLFALGCTPAAKDQPADSTQASARVGSVQQAVSNIAPAWPATWVPIQRRGVGIADPIGDTQGGAGSSRDLVGDSTHATAFVQSDANNLFFRIRLGTDPQTNPGSGELTPYGWGCEILTDDNPQTYEFIVAADGIVSPERVSFSKNTVQSGKGLDDPADKADEPALAHYAALTDTVDGKAHARVIADAGTSIGNPGGTNAYIDLAVDRADLIAAGITATTKFAVVCGSSSSAQSLSADILAVDSNRLLSVVQSDKMVCTETGCVFDLDTDADGIADEVEGEGDTDNDGVADKLDLDSDNDGIPDAIETAIDTDKDGTPDYRDLDADGDGVTDADEAGHNAPSIEGVVTCMTTVGTNGLCDDLETAADSGTINYSIRYSEQGQLKPDFQYADDSDGDGIADSKEKGPNPNQPLDSDGDGVEDYLDQDSDNDGIPDLEETAADTDNDSVPDYLDLDADNDGIWDALEAGHEKLVDLTEGTIGGPFGLNGLADSVETAPESGNLNYPLRNTDNAGAPDFQDTDSDNDGIDDKTERGPNKVPVDSDGDGLQDYRELDSDNDGLLDKLEGKADLDLDGTPNYLDRDADEDGLFDALESGSGQPVQLDGSIAGPYGTNGLANGVETTVDSGMPKFTPRDTNGDTTPDFLSTDSDGDGISDAIEKGPDGTKPRDTDGDGVPDYRDLDSDNDGIPDAIERGNGAEPVDTDGDGNPDYRDLDSDADGIPDAVEARSGAVVNPNGTIPGPYGTNGLADALETTPGSGTLNYQVPKTNGSTFDFQTQDSDNDGIPDSVEKGPDGLKPVDTNKDGTPDYLELDSDGDGISDAFETNGKGELVDTDKDGTPDYQDLDSDGDGIPDGVEGADDADMDGIPNFRDLDSDGDMLPDDYEAGPDPNNPVDTDMNGTPDYLQANDDSDADGIPDDVEFGEDGPTDTDKDGTPDHLDTDSDGDGIPDKVEAGSDPKNPVDTDKDGTPDYQDLDSDNDGIPDAVEAGADPTKPVDTDKDGTPDYLDLDSDGDGLADQKETADDFDQDGTPNYLDLDSDNDCVTDAVEGKKGTELDAALPNADANDNCGPAQVCDTKVGECVAAPDADSDNDGIPDVIEAGTDPENPVDTDKDGTPDYQDLDSDNDGLLDSLEAGKDPKSPVDSDKDGTPDYQDLDSDGDTIPDQREGALDFDRDGTPNYLDLDSDNDCLADEVEGIAGTELDARQPNLDADDNCGAGQMCDMNVGACVAAPKPEELVLEGGGPSCSASPTSTGSGWTSIAGLALAIGALRRRQQKRAS